MLLVDLTRTHAVGYYDGLQLDIDGTTDGEPLDLADGGSVDWPQGCSPIVVNTSSRAGWAWSACCQTAVEPHGRARLRIWRLAVLACVICRSPTLLPHPDTHR